jgi:hypothetical protein
MHMLVRVRIFPDQYCAGPPPPPPPPPHMCRMHGVAAKLSRVTWPLDIVTVNNLLVFSACKD